MGPERVPVVSGPRVGVVFGAGGVLGAAWMTGMLPALTERLRCPVGQAGLLLGTSAGSLLAAALRCRVSVEELIEYQYGGLVPVLGGSHVRELDGGPLPPPPQLRVGSPRLMAASLLTPHRVHPWVGASAWLPRGRANHAGLRTIVEAAHRHVHRSAQSGAALSEADLLGTVMPGAVLPGSAPPGTALTDAAMPGSAPHGTAPPDWVDDPTWIVAVDYDSGRRVIFGRDGAPSARLADAVAASCSIPGWYEPVVIGGRRYVDGGVRSPTSLGVLARAGLDEIYVLAPMASIVPDRPRKPHERLERRLRRLFTQALLREASSLRSLGTRVTVLTPGPADLAAMGANLMDPRRREIVLETSLRTSPAALAAWDAGEPRAA